MTIPVDLDTLVLQSGVHQSWDDGACLLEAVAHIAGEPFSDHPECVCPVLAAFGRVWNDALDDEPRNRLLKPFIPKLIGTRSTPDVQDARAFMAANWVVRVYTPVWLRAAGLDDEASALQALPPLSSVEACSSAMPIVSHATRTATAARATAAGAARDAAKDPALDAALAARDAGWAASWAARVGFRAAAAAAARAAAAAARDAARATAAGAAWAAWDAAWAARAAVWAAWDAAGAARTAARATARATAARYPARAARAAARDPARAAFAPQIELLQTSTVELFQQMIDL